MTDLTDFQRELIEHALENLAYEVSAKDGQEDHEILGVPNAVVLTEISYLRGVI